MKATSTEGGHVSDMLWTMEIVWKCAARMATEPRQRSSLSLAPESEKKMKAASAARIRQAQMTVTMVLNASSSLSQWTHLHGGGRPSMSRRGDGGRMGASAGALVGDL